MSVASPKKIAIPEQMLKAGWGEFCSFESSRAVSGEEFRAGLEAALQWFTEWPIEPSLEKIRRMFPNCTSPSEIKEICVKWGRNIFVAPEPEFPDQIKDLLWSPHGSYVSDLKLKQVQCECDRHNAALAEAYRRGKASR